MWDPHHDTQGDKFRNVMAINTGFIMGAIMFYGRACNILRWERCRIVLLGNFRQILGVVARVSSRFLPA